MQSAIIQKYFPNLTPRQQEQFEALDALYHEWNAKINVISRKDIDNIYPHHVLHSLGIAKAVAFLPGMEIMDIGTGGGFPGIPLAILYPECRFRLVDSIGKKVRVAEAVAKAVDLQNVVCIHENVMEEKGRFDYVVSRAVMQAPDLVKLIKKNVKAQAIGNRKGGLICLKGGDVAAEVAPCSPEAKVWPLTDWFEEKFFETKMVVYIPL